MRVTVSGEMPPSILLSMQPQPVKIFFSIGMHVNGYKRVRLITCFVVHTVSVRKFV